MLHSFAVVKKRTFAKHAEGRRGVGPSWLRPGRRSAKGGDGASGGCYGCSTEAKVLRLPAEIEVSDRRSESEGVSPLRSIGREARQELTRFSMAEMIGPGSAEDLREAAAKPTMRTRRGAGLSRWYKCASGH